MDHSVDKRDNGIDNSDHGSQHQSISIGINRDYIINNMNLINTKVSITTGITPLITSRIAASMKQRINNMTQCRVDYRDNSINTNRDHGIDNNRDHNPTTKQSH